MSGKKLRTSQSNDDPTPRPIALFLAVLFAAAISTWHWYRPLPPKATTLSNGPFVAQPDTVIAKESPRFKSKWKDSGLIFPSDDPTIESSGKPNQDADASPVASLTGNSEMALQPFREATQPINHSISQMPLPMVPVKPSQELSPPSPPESRLWTAAKRTPDALVNEQPDSDFQSHSLDTFAESASPFRVPRVDGGVRSPGPTVALKSEIWPDQGFDPKGAVAIGKGTVTTGNPTEPGTRTTTPSSEVPGLMSLSSNRIRTLEQEPEPASFTSNGSVTPRALAPTDSSSTANGVRPNPLRTPDVPKKGSVIRQPTPKNQVTK
ncbi:MAG: hypothetical protein KGQ51_11830 [Planctomycetes bacterium]|nr:hypothetical protein [Planctomycetota bacterium]